MPRTYSWERGSHILGFLKMHLASLFKEYCPEIKALMFEKKVCFQKIQNIIFQLIIYDSLKEFDFHSQVNLRTRLRGKKKALSPCS